MGETFKTWAIRFKRGNAGHVSLLPLSRTHTYSYVVLDSSAKRFVVSWRFIRAYCIRDATVSFNSGIFMNLGSYEMLAEILRCSMHSCPCGWHGDPDHACECTPNEIKRYTRKISGPLLDRIDIHVHVARVEYKDLSATTRAESSAEIRKRVVAARKIQLERFRRHHIFSNAQMNHAQIRKFCSMTQSAQSILEQIFNQLHLSARSYDRIIKVSRTIADLDKSDVIAEKHIGEAIQFRNNVGLDLH